MARSKPRFRAVKATGSCPCVPENEKELKELTTKITQEEPRFCINDIYNYDINGPLGDDQVDLESYSEVSSFGFHVENLEPSVYAIDVPSMGDQLEDYSGGNISSGQPEDSEPNDGSSSFETRKLNIAETVMSWLDNYGQARGYTLGSHGTSLLINPDDTSRLDSGSVDADEAISSKSKLQLLTNLSRTSSKQKPYQLEQMVSAYKIILSFHNDLEPLKNAKTHDIKWNTVQSVLSIWANLMSTVWKRSHDKNINRSELHGYTQLSKYLEYLALSISPVDISRFSNPVVRNSLGRIQEFLNCALKSSNEFIVIGKIEDSNLGISSWSDSTTTISVAVNERLKQTAATFATTVLECQSKHSISPKYEIVLHDVIPSKTEAGWMFFGKVELRALIDENANEIKRHINIHPHPHESGLRIAFMGSLPIMKACVDYGAIFHIVNRACVECCQYYENLTALVLKSKRFLEGPLIPISYARRFGFITRHRQYVMIGQIIAHIQADHAMDSTIAAVDEILRSFNLVLRNSIKVLEKFTKKIKCEPIQQYHEVEFKELIIPMATDCITLLFQTIRRFLALGPGSATLPRNKSPLTSVHLCLEKGINSLYKTKTSNIFSFHYCVQALFAISQLARAEEFATRAALESSMKQLTVDRLLELRKANKDAMFAFRELISLIDTRIRTAERYIDIIMKKGAKLGIIVPARTSGVLYSHRHDRYTLIRYTRNSYIRNQAKRLRQSNEVHRHTRKYVVEPDYEEMSEA